MDHAMMGDSDIGMLSQGQIEELRKHRTNLPAEFRPSAATLYAEGRPDVRQQLQRHMERFHIREEGREDLIRRLSSTKVTLNKVLLLTFLKSDRIGSIIKPDKTLDEDQYQGKVGLVIALGPLAFRDDDRTSFGSVRAKIGDWVLFRASDGVRLSIDRAHCRIIEDNLIQGIVDEPESIDLAY